MSIRGVAVDGDHRGERLDLFLTWRLGASYPKEGWSRSAIQNLITDGRITLNGRRTKSAARLKPGDRIEVFALPPRETSLRPEPMPLEILHEDEDCLVLNKPPGMAVHPGAGRQSGTLVNGLLYHCPELAGVGGERRPGIVHRLDKDTSGVMVVAKTVVVFHDLVRQFKERRVDKQYVALVWGKPGAAKGLIDDPIGRHRSDRKRMSTLRSTARARAAVTEWQVTDTFRVRPEHGPWSWVTLVRLKPRTGRTHQLRVHLAARGHPIVGDPVYGWKGGSVAASGVMAIRRLIEFPRQALHAERLAFRHPRAGKVMEFHAPLWGDMRELLAGLAAAESGHGGRSDKGVDKQCGFS